MRTKRTSYVLGNLHNIEAFNVQTLTHFKLLKSGMMKNYPFFTCCWTQKLDKQKENCEYQEENFWLDKNT